ncbi:hypothetical protein BH11CYA1_BH11CYA1_08430 [soil metagenome]
MPQSAQVSKEKKPDKGKAPIKQYAPKPFDPIEHGQVKKRGLLFLFCGVVLPAIALLFETNFHFCARHFFDPFPTAGHVVLFGLIPLSNYLVWLGTRKDLSNHYAFMSLASGMAMGVSCLYSLMFLPLTPISCFFALALGFGLLGLAPLLSVPCNLIAGKTVCHLAGRKGTYFNAHQFEHMGHMIILVMVIAIELPSTLTRMNLVKAADNNPVESSAGISWLRHYGSPEVLLRSCYERSGKATDILGSLYESAHHTTIDQNRRVFFKVTGKPYNSVPIPKAARATIQHAGAIADSSDLNAGVDDEFDIDTDIAGEEVSGVARGLSISQSEIAGQVDSNLALADLTWSFAFSNDSKFNREARAKILLPPHAVTTKATLTINNVEKDATIMVRSMARARYKKAVMEHKDPLLVSTCGADQILVQCYPVKPGETVKVKLQIAAPMTLSQSRKATMMLPAFLERNFQVDSPVKVDIKSSEPLIAGALKSSEESTTARPSYALKGEVENAQLACFGTVIAAPIRANVKLISYDMKELLGQGKITRSLQPTSYRGVKNLTIIVDGSSSMQPFYPQIAEALKALPASLNVQIKVVGDQNAELFSGFVPGGSSELLAATERLKGLKAEGGQDDSAALEDALSVATMTKDAAVLWLHAAQPLTSGTAKVQKCLKSVGRPLLFDMQVLAGPNELLSGVNHMKSLVRVDRTGNLKGDLISFLNTCAADSNGEETDGAPEYVFTQGAAISMPAEAVASGTADGSHSDNSLSLTADKRLGQIWANERIAEDLQDPLLANSSEPGLLAHAFQIISPVSSAIVTDPSATEVAAKIKHRTRFSDKFLKPMGELSAFRRKVSDGLSLDRKFQSVQEQLNSLSSAASTAMPEGSPSRSATLANGPPQAAFGGSARSGAEGQNELRKADVSDIRGPWHKQFAAPMDDKEASDEATGNQVDEDGNTTEASANTVDANGNTVDADGKPVPEADTWMLLSILALVFGATWLNNKKRKAQGS